MHQKIMHNIHYRYPFIGSQKIEQIAYKIMHVSPLKLFMHVFSPNIFIFFLMEHLHLTPIPENLKQETTRKACPSQ